MTDFFAEQPAAPTFKPTQQQMMFLQSKLPFLDPQHTTSIQTDHAKGFFSYTGLSPQQLQLIWAIANPANSKQLNYVQVLVAFRLVSYAQNGIPISKPNVDMNIPVKLPVLRDDDDDDGPPPQQSAQFSQQQFPQQQFSQQQFSQGQPTQKTFKTQSSIPPRSDIADFCKMWQRLDTHDGMISGQTVKKLYRRVASKTSLAKAWRLCCTTCRGHLTKGQLFAFLHLIKLAQDGKPLPDELGPEAKEIVDEIDQHNKKEFNSTMEKLDQKASYLRSRRVIVANSVRELAFTHASIARIIDNIDGFAAQMEGKLEAADRFVTERSNTRNIQQLGEHFRRLTIVANRQYQIIDGLKEGKLPTEPQPPKPSRIQPQQQPKQPKQQSQSDSYEQKRKLQDLQNKVIDMVKSMNDLDSDQIQAMRDQLADLNYHDLKNLHDQVVEKYNEFQRDKSRSSNNSSYY